VDRRQPDPGRPHPLGRLRQAGDDSLNAQHEIVEGRRDAAKAAPGSIEQKIGWLYRSGMDEAAIEKAGFARSSRPRRIAR
jgi:putative endopeptidase